MQKLERSIHSYFNTKLVLRNSRSQRVIKAGLDNFEKFTKEFYNKTLDEMIGEFSDQDVVFDVLQEWINWNGKRINPKTVKHYFILIKPYLHYRGIKFHPLDIKENLTFPKVLENEKHGITLHEIKALFEYLNPKNCLDKHLSLNVCYNLYHHPKEPQRYDKDLDNLLKLLLDVLPQHMDNTPDPKPVGLGLMRDNDDKMIFEINCSKILVENESDEGLDIEIKEVINSENS